MALDPAVTALEHLGDLPEVACLRAWNASALKEAKLDRGELTLWVDRLLVREACLTLKRDSQLQYNFLSDVTCVDWYPNEPRFEVVYHLLSIPTKKRVRLKVRLA